MNATTVATTGAAGVAVGEGVDRGGGGGEDVDGVCGVVTVDAPPETGVGGVFGVEGVPGATPGMGAPAAGGNISICVRAKPQPLANLTRALTLELSIKLVRPVSSLCAQRRPVL